MPERAAIQGLDRCEDPDRNIPVSVQLDAAPRDSLEPESAVFK